MDDLRGRLAAFVPRTIWPLLGDGKKSARMDGCVLFADVAGFTPLTEGLAKIGREGAEELTRILNGFFKAMIAIVHQESGDVLRFGGDAMTLFFSAGVDGGLRAAVRMQKEALRFQEIETRGGVFPLAMKIGISYGSVVTGIVGDAKNGFDYFAAGSALDLSAEAEHHAEKRQIALCPKCLGLIGNLPPGIKRLEDGFGLIRDPLEFRVAAAPKYRQGDGEPSLPTEPDLSDFLPPFIREKASIPESLNVAEHRKTVTLFLMFKGLDYDCDPEIEEKVKVVYTRISSAVKKYGGTVNKIDMGDKGSKAIGLFGTPYALENQEEMGCRAALEILEDQELRPLLTDLKIGLTSAPLFAAYVGCDERREYTVMGDGINLAARLMANAFSWRSLASKEICEQASSKLAFRALDPIFVKGKAEKVAIFRPEGEIDASLSRRAKFVGRDSLVEETLASLSDLKTPFVARVTGEAGVGKSAFLHTLGVGLDRLGIRHATVPLASFQSTSYLTVWKSVFLNSLGVSRGDPHEMRVEAFRAALSEEDQVYIPLFNSFLGMDLPDNESTKNLQAKERKDITFAILTRLIKGQASEAPYGIFLDQLEYADPASLEFLLSLLSEAVDLPLKILLSYRTDAPDSIKGSLSSLKCIQIEPFVASEMKLYLTKIAGMAPPPESLIEFLLKKTRGNPKFLEQMVSAFLKENLLAQGPSGLLEIDEDRMESTAFPDTLEGLLLSRVDSLQEHEKQLIKSSSVLGTSFSLPLLSALTGTDQRSVEGMIKGMEVKGIVRMDSWGSRAYGTFTDNLLKDALYGSLTYSVKRDLHLKAAQILDRESQGESNLWPILAFHFEAAGEEQRAADYLWKASEDARSKSDNISALDYLRRYVTIRERAGATPAGDETFRKALLHLAKASKDMGKFDDAVSFSQRILDEVKNLCPERVEALTYIAGNHRRTGDLKMSRDLYRMAMLHARKIDNVEQECWILLDSAVPLAMLGRMDDAMRQFKQAEAIAKKMHMHSALVFALMNQGLCQYGSGQREKAIEILKKARQVARSKGLKYNLCCLQINLGQMLSDLGEYGKALEFIDEGYSLAKQFGYRNLYMATLTNKALLQCMLGEIGGAGQSAEEALTSARHHNIMDYFAMNLNTLGLIHLLRGDYGRALKDLEEALGHLAAASMHRNAVSCINEIIALANILRMPALADPVLAKYSAGMEEELAQEGLQWVIGFNCQGAILKHRKRETSDSETEASLTKCLNLAKETGVLWLVAEVGESLIRHLGESGKTGRAVEVGMDIFGALSRHDCPLKIGPFCIALGESLMDSGRGKEMEPLMRILRGYDKRIHCGLSGIRLNHLLSRHSLLSHAFSSARARRQAAIAMIYEISIRMGRQDIREAFFKLPEIRDVLKGDEPT